MTMFALALRSLAARILGTIVVLIVAATGSAQARVDTFERDRQSILAMSGNYKVRFDFRETASFLADYTPFVAKTSGGHEIVRVVEDSGRKIVLQHILVVNAGGKDIVVKHWRQDWVYEPASVMVYSGPNRWELAPVAEANRIGAWSQTVWQTDDSPRYGGIGRWDYRNESAVWQSNETSRPLARRDATRKPPYHMYRATNRHALVPGGWIHEQDNAKIGERGGRNVTFVHEVALNTYTKFDEFPVKLGDEYWTKTKAYWAEVRAAWDQAFAAGGGRIVLQEEPDAGAVTGPELMGLADKIVAGEIAETAAVESARRIISSATAVKEVAK
jgi:hypothetical protein